VIATATGDSYFDHVKDVERGLSDAAFTSDKVSLLADRSDAVKWFEDQWQSTEGRARLTGRSPLMLERDRILYSDEFRAQSGRHHMLFSAGARTARDYSAHILRMSQVSRAICGRLDLNSSLAEAIALGAKVGGVPFIHVGKNAVDAWVRGRIKDLDTGSDYPISGTRDNSEQLAFLDPEGNELPLPTWIDDIKSPDLRRDVRRYLPWAAGTASSTAYSSGQQSYWTLSLNQFQLSAKRPYIPETLYGIWNHSLTAPRDTPKFMHSVKLADGKTELALSDANLTHEAVVVRHADDISWVIENISEAAKADQLAGSGRDLLTLLARELQSSDMPQELHTALIPVADIGRIYTYFINDLVATSQPGLLDAMGIHPSETEPTIHFSATASRMMRLMKQFLNSTVFTEERLQYRNRTLVAITETVLDVYWETRGAALTEYVNNLAKLEGWNRDQLADALALLDRPIHRVQACVDALAGMSDRAVYRLLGLESE
jgi:dGTP triphosphohydrolase